MNTIMTVKDNEFGKKLDQILSECNIQKPLIVVDEGFQHLSIREEVMRLEHKSKFFSNLTPNPNYESVLRGVHFYKEKDCDGIIAIGGGSALDVAKAIKLFATMDSSYSYLEQVPEGNDIVLIAAPTTAAGSEATKYGVIYYEGSKQTLIHDSIIPSYVLLDSTVYESLPPYQRKVTFMDAMCHSIEAYWSIKSTDESKAYADEAIRLLIKNKDGYMENDPEANENIMRAADLAGKAINISATTAPHAMSYKITVNHGIAHGHAVALCLPRLWSYMSNNIEKCIDERGSDYLQEIFIKISRAMGCKTVTEAISLFGKIVKEFELSVPEMAGEIELKELVMSVNQLNMKNNPVSLENKILAVLYRKIFSK